MRVISNFLHKYSITVVCCLLLLLVLSLFFAWKSNAELSKYKESLTGTYVAGEEESPDAEYYAFTDQSEKVYYRFNQNKLLEKGTYEKGEDNIFVLTFGDNKYQIVFGNGDVYSAYPDSETISTYKKIAKEPTLINMEGKE